MLPWVGDPVYCDDLWFGFWPVDFASVEDGYHASLWAVCADAYEDVGGEDIAANGEFICNKREEPVAFLDICVHCSIANIVVRIVFKLRKYRHVKQVRYVKQVRDLCIRAGLSFRNYVYRDLVWIPKAFVAWRDGSANDFGGCSIDIYSSRYPPVVTVDKADVFEQFGMLCNVKTNIRFGRVN